VLEGDPEKAGLVTKNLGRRPFFVLLIGVALPLEAGAAPAAHLVDAATCDAALRARHDSRNRDLATMSIFLRASSTVDAARAIGFDSLQLTREVALLNDQELHDLALRAEALRTDPVAGMSRTAWILIVIVALAIVITAATGGGIASIE
jgi:hypothetical protein